MPHPSELRSFRRHAEWALVAATAEELGVFERLGRGPAALDALAEDLGLSPRGLSILLGALVELDLVRSEPDGRWALTGLARGHLLDPDTPDYQGDAFRLWLRNIRGWAVDLPGSVASGEPPGEEEDDPEERRAALEEFQAAMANKSPELVEQVVDGCLERVSSPRRVLDLGGGPGTFTREFVRRGLDAVLFDRPEVVEHVADSYELAGIHEITLVGGDFLEELPEGEFDVVLLANITHIFDPDANADLIRRLAPRIRRGGVLAIMDFVRGREPFASLFAVTMLLNTERGNTYSLPEYERWLRDAGLSRVRCRTLREERGLVTAVRE